MFAALKTLVKTEWKRFLKYTIVTGTLCAGTAGTMGYFVMNTVAEEFENEILEIPFFTFPVYKLIMGRLIAKAKREGAEACAVQGGFYGIIAGSSLGASRVGLGVAYRTIKWVFTRGKVKS
jgi:hypothetical protein